MQWFAVDGDTASFDSCLEGIYRVGSQVWDGPRLSCHRHLKRALVSSQRDWLNAPVMKTWGELLSTGTGNEKRQDLKKAYIVTIIEQE